MRFFHLDESGYAEGDWRSEVNLAEQPFHIFSAVSFPVEVIPTLYEEIRAGISGLKIDGVVGESIGNGVEIKARDIAKGSGYWGKNEKERNVLRILFLGSVSKYGGTAF